MDNDPIRNLLQESLWEAPSVVDQPTIRLVRWRVVEVRTRELEIEHHFVGYNVDGCEGRVSTAIQGIDMLTRKGITRSGRAYVLSGPPGHDPDAAWVWEHWCRLNGITDPKDVTSEVWNLMQTYNKS